MDLLLAQPMGYLYGIGGAHKANRLLMEGLAARGHACRVLIPGNFIGAFSIMESDKTRAQLLNELADSGIRLLSSSEQEDVYLCNGVEVYAVKDYLTLCSLLPQYLQRFNPHCLLLSEDTAHVMLGAALEAAPERLVYISHSPASLPFGPDSFAPDAAKASMLPRAAGVISVSEYLTRYLQRWGEVSAQTIRFPVYGSAPFPRLADFDQGYVTMINPCAVKGRSIFVELARRFPEVEFAAVPTWGAVEQDREMLKELRNVRVLMPSAEIEEILRQTKVLVAPSLWGEAFGQVVVEAMLRGIPVIGSDAGGLPEAKLGVDYVIGVRKIERYEARVDEQQKIAYEAVIAEQEMSGWEEALRELTSNRERYEGLSEESRVAAERFVESLSFAPFEDYFAQVIKERAEKHSRVQEMQAAPFINSLQSEHGLQSERRRSLRELMDTLSTEKRALLVQRLKRPAAPPTE